MELLRVVSTQAAYAPEGPGLDYLIGGEKRKASNQTANIRGRQYMA